jgi:hypothetical protein
MLGPTVIAKLVMIDTLGAWPASARDTPRILAESAAFVAASSQPHESIQSAAEYRAKKNFVGLMHIDDALLLAQRGTVPAPQHGTQRSGVELRPVSQARVATPNDARPGAGVRRSAARADARAAGTRRAVQFDLDAVWKARDIVW